MGPLSESPAPSPPEPCCWDPFLMPDFTPFRLHLFALKMPSRGE